MGNRYQNYLTTPNRVIKYLLSADPSSVPTEGTAQYNEIVRFLSQQIPFVSTEIQERVGQMSFVPYIDSKRWTDDELGDRFFRVACKVFRLCLNEHALDVTAITYFGTSLTVYDPDANAGDYILQPQTDYPYSRIDISDDAAYTLNGFGDNITVEGWWGYHTNENELYTATPDTSITIADSSATGIIVADASEYETYQYLRIEDELMLITAIDTDTKTLTVTRGVNGTTAIEHASQPLQHVTPVQDIVSLATAMCAYRYQNRNMVADSVQVSGNAIIIPKLADQYQTIIDRYKQIGDGMRIGITSVR